MAQNLPRGTPARVLVLLAMLVGLVVVSAWRDALRQDTETWVRHPTALGDTAMLLPGQLPVQLDTGGKIVSLTSGGPAFHRRDDRMFRVTTGVEAGLPFALFSTREQLAEEADPKLYARTAPHQYLRLRARIGPVSVDPPPLSAPDPVPAAIPAESSARPPPEVSPPPIPKAIPLGPEEQDFPAENPEKGTL